MRGPAPAAAGRCHRLACPVFRSRARHQCHRQAAPLRVVEQARSSCHLPGGWRAAGWKDQTLQLLQLEISRYGAGAQGSQHLQIKVRAAKAEITGAELQHHVGQVQGLQAPPRRRGELGVGVPPRLLGCRTKYSSTSFELVQADQGRRVFTA